MRLGVGWSEEPRECVWRNDEVRGIVERNGASWKELLGVRDEDVRCK